MWTLQEFCASAQLMIAREDKAAGPSGDEESGDGDTAAVKGVEGIHSEAQRTQHLAAQEKIMPVWISDDVESLVASIPKEEAVRMWRAFSVLSENRHCLYKADRVRAL